MTLRPIANKYGDGKMKRTLERELKVPEIDAKEANGTSFSFQIVVT
jgi:dissimilatory sulfite reductase (desulfoviridin) alpha/beta subunit